MFRSISSDPPAIEDIQEIITALPNPNELPKISFSSENFQRNTGVIQGNSNGLVLNQGSYNGISPRASFVLPPSIIRK